MTPLFHQLKDKFVNLYLIAEPAGFTLIDAGTAGGRQVVERVLRENGYGLDALRNILITHSDMDHVGAAAALKAASGATLYASAPEAQAMARGEPSRMPRGNPVTRGLFNLFASFFPIAPAAVDHILEPGQELPILGGLRVLETPGHTPGHTSFYAPAHRLLFAGDSMMSTKGGLRFVDGPVTWDYRRGQRSVREQAALQPAIVCCGHGPVARGDAIRFPLFEAQTAT